MNLKGHMQVLLEEKRQIEKPIEEDLRAYARLSVEIETKKKEYERKKSDLLDMEKFFRNFEQEDVFSRNSIHIRTLKREIKEIEGQLAMLRNKMGEKQKYYEALGKADYMALADIGSEEGYIAAIERLYSMPKKAAGVAYRVELAKKLEKDLRSSDSAEKIVGYLIASYLIFREQHGGSAQEIDAERELYDNLMKKYRPKKRNRLWESIEQVYQSIEVEQLIAQCTQQINEFERFASRGESVAESFDRTCELIEKQMRRLLPVVKGIGMELKAEKVRRWYWLSYWRTDRLLRRWRVQNRTFRREHRKLIKVRERLMEGREEGISKKKCEEFRQTLNRTRGAQDSFVNAYDIQKAVTGMTKEFENQVEDITLEKNRLVQRKGLR